MSAEHPTTSVEYREIPGFPGYHAGDDGSIWCSHNTRRVPCPWRRIRGYVTPKGYVRVTLQSEANCHAMKMAHDIVLTAFVGPRPEGMQVCHWDGDKLNNRLSNLRWGTAADNAVDKIRLGEVPDVTGSKNPRATITESEAVEIRRLAESGVKYNEIMARFGVSRLVVSKIKTRRTWAHLS